MDEQQSAHMLTDGLLRVPEESTLNEFNRAARSEKVVISKSNVTDYLQFFINGHLNWCEGLYFGDNAMAQKVKRAWQQSNVRKMEEEIDSLKAEVAPLGRIPVAEIRDRHEFKAAVFEWRPAGTPPAMKRYDITIYHGGTIDVSSVWIWRTAPQHGQ